MAFIHMMIQFVNYIYRPYSNSSRFNIFQTFHILKRHFPFFPMSTYAKWCEENGEFQLKQNWFGRKLREKEIDSKILGSNRVRYWMGIDLVDQF